jgi:hypothetical protein
MATTKDNLVAASWADRSQSLLENTNQLLFKFFIVKLKDGNFHDYSPFLIHKSIESTIGRVKSVKKLKSGDLLIQADSVSQTVTLLDCKTLGNLPVSVTPHSTLNFSRGVISEPDLRLIPENEILENLKSQQVCAVRKITTRRDGNVQPTNHIILTFNSPELPTFIMAGYLRCPVRPYIPNPLRCFQCQRFGHSKISCRGTVTCARCSEVGHDSEKCTKTPKCVNCKGDHPSFARSCPIWVREKEIQALKTGKNISFQEARKIVLSRTPKPGISFSAAVTSKSVVSIATQTDLSQCNILNKLTMNNPKRSNPKPEAKITSVNTLKPNPVNKNIKQTEMKKPCLPSNNVNDLTNKPIKKRKSREKSKSHPITNVPKYTRRDFLKNRPINETEDALKMYVSSEEDMATDGTWESEVEISTSAPC